MSDYLPPELISRILTRLPVKTLLRCTSVCKSWYSLITSPSFISSHLNLSTPNQEPRVLIRYKVYYKNEYNIATSEEERYCVHRDDKQFDKIDAEMDWPFLGFTVFKVIGTLNGLFCLSYAKMETIILWNPSLRKSLTLPKPRVIKESVCYYHHTIGFGFLPATNDYKIVRVTYLLLRSGGGEKVPPEVEIYELSTGSWRSVNAGDFSYVTLWGTPQAFLKGVVHWAAYNPNKVGGTFIRLIVSFDMTSEKFGALMLPNCMQNEYGELRVSTFQESLCSIHFQNDFCRIWVMKEYGVADSWARQFNIDVGYRRLMRTLYFRENSEILFVDGFGNSVVDSCSLVSYDSVKNQVKNVGFNEKADPFYIGSYLESLVLIKGSNEVLGRVSHPSRLRKDDEDKGKKKARIKENLSEYTQSF